MGYVRYILIVSMFVLQLVVGTPGVYLSSDHYWLRATTYSFFHASWWHFAINSLAIWSIYPEKRPCKPCRDLLFPYIISVLVYPLSLRPVIGFSNILYAVLGMRTPPLSSPWWKQTPVIVFLVVTVALVFVPQFSATTHIAAFLIGMLLASAGRAITKIRNDAGRYL